MTRRPRRGSAVVVTAAAMAIVVTSCGTKEPASVDARPAPVSPTATALAPGSALEAFGPAPLPDGAPEPVAQAQVAEPTAVRVPSLGISSALVDLGVATDGSVEVPADFDVAGWFTDGPKPGERGPAVILGHVDSRSGPAVFAQVDQMRPGDVIEVDRADGSTVRFRVDRLEQVPKDEFPSAAVYGPVPEPALRLITCGGEFDAAAGHYRDNVVVYAVPA